MKFLKIFLLLILLGGLLISAAAWWVTQYSYSPSRFADTKVFIVEKGRGIQQIAKEMEQQGIVQHPIILVALAKYENLNTPKFGEYAFTPDMSPFDILQRMQKGETILRKVVVPEGKTVIEIYEILKKSEKLKFIATEADLPKEGTLLPSTYYYTYGDTDLDVLNQMKKGMDTLLNDLWEKRADNIPVKTKEEALTLASIVEKETGIDGERGLVASVFVNRINKGMKLESDPTAVYGITKGAALGRIPGAKDVRHENEYNTYLIPALPPTPICNPGRLALEAVLNPPVSDYFFFVANGTGGHNFSVTYDEHLKNIKLYREALKASKAN